LANSNYGGNQFRPWTKHLSSHCQDSRGNAAQHAQPNSLRLRPHGIGESSRLMDFHEDPEGRCRLSDGAILRLGDCDPSFPSGPRPRYSPSPQSDPSGVADISKERRVQTRHSAGAKEYEKLSASPRNTSLPDQMERWGDPAELHRSAVARDHDADLIVAALMTQARSRADGKYGIDGEDDSIGGCCSSPRVSHFSFLPRIRHSAQ